METKKVTKKNKVWIAGCIGFTIGIMLLIAGCGAKMYIVDKDLIGGPYPPSKDLPRVVGWYDDLSTLALTNMGTIEVLGSEKRALKAAASLGARVVRLNPTTIGKKVSRPYDMFDPYSSRYTETVQEKGYMVGLYR